MDETPQIMFQHLLRTLCFENLIWEKILEIYIFWFKKLVMRNCKSINLNEPFIMIPSFIILIHSNSFSSRSVSVGLFVHSLHNTISKFSRKCFGCGCLWYISVWKIYFVQNFSVYRLLHSFFPVFIFPLIASNLN